MGQQLHSALRPREPRIKVRIPVRMRAGADWSDMCMLDVSSRGLLMQGADAPPTGSYIEVRRGRHVIVARVMWVNKGRCGARTQDIVPVEAITSERGEAANTDAASGTAQPAERRTEARPHRPEHWHDRSRQLGRSMQFGFVLVAATGLAILCGSLARTAMLNPLSTITAALG